MMILRRRRHAWVLPILTIVGCAGAFPFGGLGGTAVPQIPKSPRERNQQVVQAVQAALRSPRTPSFRLIECEFPAVAQLNKLGDGSLRSATAVEDANLETAQALVRALSPLLPGVFGPLVWLLTSTAATNSLQTKADKVAKAAGGNHHSLKRGLPAGVKSRDVCVLVTPSNGQDYEWAKRIANNGNSVVLINGFAKVRTRQRILIKGRIQIVLQPLTVYPRLELRATQPTIPCPFLHRRHDQTIHYSHRTQKACRETPPWRTTSNRSRTIRPWQDTCSALSRDPGPSCSTRAAAVVRRCYWAAPRMPKYSCPIPTPPISARPCGWCKRPSTSGPFGQGSSSSNRRRRGGADSRAHRRHVCCGAVIL